MKFYLKRPVFFDVFSKAISWALCIGIGLGAHPLPPTAWAHDSDLTEVDTLDPSPLSIEDDTPPQPSQGEIDRLAAYLEGKHGAFHPADYYRLIPQRVPGISRQHDELHTQAIDIKTKALRDTLAAQGADAREPSVDELHEIKKQVDFEVFSQLQIDRKFLRALKLRDLLIRTKNEHGQALDEYSTAIMRRQKNFVFGENIASFEILYRGIVIHEFFIPCRSLALYKNLILFTEERTNEISFIDLESHHSDIGFSELPVYRLVDGDWNFSYAKNSHLVFQIRNGMLFYADTPVTDSQISWFREFQETGFRAMAGLIDPKTHAQVSEVIPSFMSYWAHAKNLIQEQGFENPHENHPVNQQVENYFDRLQSSLQQGTNLKKLKAEESSPVAIEKLEKSLKAWNQHQTYKSELTTRISHLWGQLTLPKPQGAHSIKAGLALMASQLEAKNSKVFRRTHLREATLQIANSRYGQALAIGSATFAAYQMFPAETWAVTFSAAQTFLNTNLLIWDSIKTAVGGFSSAYDAYLAPNHIGHFVHSIFALTGLLGAVIFIPLMVTNFYYFAKALPKYFGNENETTYRKLFESILYQRKSGDVPLVVRKMATDAIRFVPRLWNAFIDHQEYNRDKLLQEQSLATAKKRGTEAKQEWLEDENQEALKIANNLWETAFPGKPNKVRKSSYGQKINTMREALKYFFLGEASIENMHSLLVPTWSVWTGFRTLCLKPHLMATVMFYPNFYRRVIPSSDAHIENLKDLPKARGASFWNGGLRPFYESAFLALRHLGRDQNQALLKTFETRISNLELNIQKKVLSETFLAMIADTTDVTELHRLFRIKGGFQAVSQEDLFEIRGAGRVYFGTFYKNVNEEATRMVVQELIRKSDPVNRTLNLNLPNPDLKSLAWKLISTYEMSPEEISSLVHRAISNTNARAKAQQAAINAKLHSFREMAQSLKSFAEFTKSVSQQIRGIDTRFRNWSNLWTFNMVNSLTSIPIFEKIQVIDNQMKSPLARARTVSSFQSRLTVKIPIAVLFTFITYAGVTSGLSQPLLDDVHSTYSWHHLSKAVWFAFAFKTATELSGGTWNKLYVDSRQHAKFGYAPGAQEAHLSFAKYYFQNLRTPGNSMWLNHVHKMKMTLANLPAAFVTYSFLYATSLGRFDLDSYVMSHLFALGVPIYSSLATKFEQAFELAAGYDLKSVPLKFRSHPVVQEALNRVILARRRMFNLMSIPVMETYDNVWSLLKTIDHPAIGPRAGARLLFGGQMLAESVTNGMYHTAEAIKTVTGIDTHGPMKRCAMLLLKGNKEAVKALYLKK